MHRKSSANKFAETALMVIRLQADLHLPCGGASTTGFGMNSTRLILQIIIQVCSSASRCPSHTIQKRSAHTRTVWITVSAKQRQSHLLSRLGCKIIRPCRSIRRVFKAIEQIFSIKRSSSSHRTGNGGSLSLFLCPHPSLSPMGAAAATA